MAGHIFITPQYQVNIKTIATQLVIDNSIYFLGNYLINYAWAAKTRSAKNAQATQPEKVSEKPVITVPKAAFSVQSLWKKMVQAAPLSNTLNISA